MRRESLHGDNSSFTPYLPSRPPAPSLVDRSCVSTAELIFNTDLLGGKRLSFVFDYVFTSERNFLSLKSLMRLRPLVNFRATAASENRCATENNCDNKFSGATSHREEKRLQNSQKSQNIGEKWEGDNPKRRSERRAKELQIRAQARAEESITEI